MRDLYISHLGTITDMDKIDTVLERKIKKQFIKEDLINYEEKIWC